MNFKIFIILITLSAGISNLAAEQSNKEISFYTGVFDTIDKEGDDSIIWIRT